MIETLTTIAVWLGYILGGLLALFIIAVGLLLWLVTRMDEDDYFDMRFDAPDEYLINSARGETHRAKYPEERRGF